VVVNHRANMYTVGVHKLYKPKERQPFNDFDGKGTSLGAVLNGYLSNAFSEEGDDKVVHCVASNVVGDEVQALLTHGLSGIAATIRNQQGVETFQQHPEDTHEIRCGAVVRLPGAATTGWWAAHVFSNRSAMGLLKYGLVRRFQNDYPKLRLAVEPCVSGAALKAAVEAGEVEEVTLIRYDKPNDVRDRITDEWVRRNQSARVEVGIRAGRGENILNGRLRRYFGGEKELFGEIVEFNGLRFDEAKIEVTLASGASRTFNIENPESGHAFSVNLEDLDIQDGDPTPSSLFASMDDAIDEMVQQLA
jgi:hypothetical protein